MASRQKKLDEKHSKLIRELSTQLENKHCFDCNQRGPTYVNMTIGSFVCTGCSGLLRGINPPHRVKSISMATFTADDIEFMKTKGNDACKSVWLGLFDGNASRLETYRDEQHIKDFLVMKYERKRWYVSPSEIDRQRRLMEQAKLNVTAGGSALQTAPTNSNSNDLFSLLDAVPPAAVQPSTAGDSWTSSVPPPAHAAPARSAFSLMGDDPFASPPKHVEHAAPPVAPINVAPQPPPAVAPAFPSSNNSGGFADFANFDAQPTPATTNFDAAFNTSTVSNGGSAHFPVSFNGDSVGVPIQHQQQHPQPIQSSPFNGFGSPPRSQHNGSLMAPMSSTTTSHHVAPLPAPVAAVPPPQATATTGGDMYSALADLDSLFSSCTTNSASLDMTMPTTGQVKAHAPPAVKMLSTEPLPAVGGEVNWGGASMFTPSANNSNGVAYGGHAQQTPQYQQQPPQQHFQAQQPQHVQPHQPHMNQQHSQFQPQQQPIQPQHQQHNWGQPAQPTSATIGAPNWNPFLS